VLAIGATGCRFRRQQAAIANKLAAGRHRLFRFAALISFRKSKKLRERRRTGQFRYAQ